MPPAAALVPVLKEMVPLLPEEVVGPVKNSRDPEVPVATVPLLSTRDPVEPDKKTPRCTVQGQEAFVDASANQSKKRWLCCGLSPQPPPSHTWHTPMLPARWSLHPRLQHKYAMSLHSEHKKPPTACPTASLHSVHP